MGLPGNKHSLSKSTHSPLIAFKRMIMFGFGLEFSENQNQQKKYIPNTVCVCVCVCVCMQIEREKEVYFKELVWMIVRSANLEIYIAGQQAANL